MMSPITRQLTSLIKGRVPFTDRLVEWEYIVRVAREVSILPRLAAMSSDFSNLETLPRYVLNHFQAARCSSELLKQHVYFEAEGLVKLINSVSDEPPIFLKGAAYLLAKYKVGEGRVFSDIDILVLKELVDSVENKLLVYGWIHDEIDDYEQMYYRKWAHEIPPLMHCTRGTQLDVHHNLVPIISGKAPDIELFKNHLVSICNGQAKTLAPYAMVLHSAVHLFYQEEYHHGFRDLSDLHLMFCEFGESEGFWEELFLLAHRTNFTTELGLACRYTNLFFDSPIPDNWLLKSEGFLPSRVTMVFFDWIFYRVLQPQHPLCKVPHIGLANLIAMIRGHWIKMPLPILIQHVSTKAYKAIGEMIAGKGAFKKNKEQELPENLPKI